MMNAKTAAAVNAEVSELVQILNDGRFSKRAQAIEYASTMLRILQLDKNAYVLSTQVTFCDHSLDRVVPEPKLSVLLDLSFVTVLPGCSCKEE